MTRRFSGGEARFRTLVGGGYTEPWQPSDSGRTKLSTWRRLVTSGVRCASKCCKARLDPAGCGRSTPSGWRRLLKRELPGVNVGAGHAYLGHCCCNQFNDWGVPFVPYALRHAYSRRGMEFGLAPDFMAKAMGHTLAVHVQTYRAWIGEDAYDSIFNNALKTQGRPRPPEL